MAQLVIAKRTLIDKANTTVVIVVSVATFLLVFSIIATKSFIQQAQYQNKVIQKKRVAVITLKEDIESTKKLQASYVAFTTTSKNAIGGISTGSGKQDGNNAKIILDALPSTYDFPELTTSLESILSDQNVRFNSINGTDDEVTQSANLVSSNPEAIAIPFELTVSGQYDNIRNVLAALESSIRPMQINSLSIAGNQDELTLSVVAQTYFQPAKSLNIRSVIVK